MKTRKIFVVGGDTRYANWMEGHIAWTIEEADLVVFTGGEDVDPSYYSAKANPRTACNPARDMAEMKVFQKANALGKKLIGICRGSQFLCVMAGGELVQHQQNPSFIHPITTYDGKQILVSSTHHQAQFPWPLLYDQYKVLGWTQDMSIYHEDGEGAEMVNSLVENDKEVEIAYYPEIKALAIQSHPEMIFGQRDNDGKIAESIAYCRNLLDLHMSDKL
jgi:gamma-glutamyl-gamma-aminobutyrate hydrolase PuuD